MDRFFALCSTLYFYRLDSPIGQDSYGDPDAHAGHVGPKLSTEQLWRVELEVGHRAAVAGIFHVLVYLAFRFLTPFSTEPSILIDWPGVGILACMTARLLLFAAQKSRSTDLKWRGKWKIMFRGISFVLASCWGLLLIFTLSAFEITLPSLILTLINIGIAAIAIQAFGLDLFQVRIFVPLIIGLPLLSLFFIPMEGRWALMACLALYLGYLMFLANKAHALLWETMENREIMQSQKDQLTAVLDAIPGYVFWTDGLGRYLGYNKLLGEALGSQTELVFGKHVDSPAEFLPFLSSSATEQLIETQLRLDKAPRWVLVAMKKYRSGNDIHAVGIALDIEEQKRAEKELEDARAKAMESARLAALGTMAAGIAHEINNPLQVIRSLTQFLTNPPAAKIVDTRDLGKRIDGMTDRIARIISSLRTFSRPGNTDPLEAANVKELLSEIVELMRISRPAHDIPIDIGNVPPELSFECRRVEIGQVLINLINNALDAVEALPERWVFLSARDMDNSVEIRIIDSGPGIPEPLLDKIMLPFFTTKLAKHGIGLGLSISASIMERYHGRLWIDRSSPHTCFVVTLPKKQSMGGAT